MPLVITLFIVSFLLTRLATPRFSQLLQAGGAVRKNYAGNQIPTAAGISIIAALAATYFLAAVFAPPDRIIILSALAVILTIGMLGLVDDLLGTRDTTGIKGHLSMLLKGRLTTGGLKALGGGGLALAFSLLFSDSLIHILVNTLIIALFTNAINLTDLRPGRAGKAFLIIGLFFLLGSIYSVPAAALLLVPVYGSLLAF